MHVKLGFKLGCEICGKAVDSSMHGCQAIKSNLKASYQEIRVTFQGALGSIMYTAHFYNALRKENLLSKQWEDMDLVLSWHDEIFVGDPPSQPADYLKRYALSMGYSAAALARNKLQTDKLPESRTGPKGVQPAASVSRVFIDRYCMGSGQIGFSESDLKTTLAGAIWGDDDEGQQHERKEGIISMQRSTASKNKTKNKSPVKKHTDQLTIVELLETLCNTLQSEALEFSFDYLELHRVCWKTLRLLRTVCDPYLRKIHGVEYLENETQLPFVVGYIFMAVAGTDWLCKALAQKDEVVSKILICAAEVVEGLLDIPAGSAAVQSLAIRSEEISTI